MHLLLQDVHWRETSQQEPGRSPEVIQQRPMGHHPRMAILQGAAASAAWPCWVLHKKRSSALKFGSGRGAAMNLQGWDQYHNVTAQTHYIHYLFEIILFKTCFSCPLLSR